MSSDEEDRHKRAQLQVKHRKLDTNKVNAQISDADYTEIFELAHQKGLSKSECPQLCPISQLTRDFAHLHKDTDCKLAFSKSQPLTSASSSNKERLKAQQQDENMLDTSQTEEQIMQKHAEQARVLPYKVVAFAEKMRELTPIRFYNEDATQAISQQELESQLIQNRLVLPYLRASFERLLLAESGTFKDPRTNQTRTYPACAKGERCIGKLVKFRHLPRQGVVFTALMYPEEYELFLQTGATPSHNRPCILCCREALVHWTIMCRADQMMGGPGASTPISSMPWQMQQTQIRQLYYNSVDQPEGYQKDRVLMPSANEPLVHPLAMLCRTHLWAFQKHGRWFIDQSAIEWKSPEMPQPNIGETHADF